MNFFIGIGILLAICFGILAFRFQTKVFKVLCCVFPILFLLSLMLWYKLERRSIEIHSKLTADKFVFYLKEGDLDASYALFNESLHQSFDKYKLEGLLHAIQEDVPCLDYKVSNIRSKKDFTLVLNDCESSQKIATVFFSKEPWGFGWEVAHIDLVQ